MAKTTDGQITYFFQIYIANTVVDMMVLSQYTESDVLNSPSNGTTESKDTEVPELRTFIDQCK